MSTPTETACAGLRAGGQNAIHCPRCARLATLQAENAEWKRQLDETRRDFVAFQDMHHREAASLRERLAAFEFAAKGTIALKESRATAAEGERDRLRVLLERCCLFIPEKGAIWRDINAALAAIPHTEGEASAPPKETE